jgi:hypothetical protein
LQTGCDQSFPKVFKNPYDLKGFYRFLNHEGVSPKDILASYRLGLTQWMSSLAKAERPNHLYLFQDSTFGKYHGRKVDLGYLERRDDNGVLIHNGILTDEHFVPCGLAVQEFIQRERSDFGKKALRHKRPFEQKESYKWVEGFDFGRKFQRKTGIAILQVFDSEADIADLFNYASKHRQSFLVRSHHNRKEITNGQYLQQCIGQMPLAGRIKRSILDKQGRKHLRDCEVRFDQFHFEEINNPLYVIDLQQVEVIENQDNAHWTILTNLPVTNLAQAEHLIEVYSKRWTTCEDFHKCLKTGCAIHERQLNTPQALFNAITLLSLLAIALLRTRHLAQSDAEQSVETILTPNEFKLAQILDQKYLMPIDRTLCKKDSVLWLILLLGRMGGHQGLKNFGLPGWQSIWAGWNYFQNLVDGFNMSMNYAFFKNP